MLRVGPHVFHELPKTIQVPNKLTHFNPNNRTCYLPIDPLVPTVRTYEEDGEYWREENNVAL